MKSLGSPVKVGKMDATSYSSKQLLGLLFFCSRNQVFLEAVFKITGRRDFRLCFTS